MSQVASLATIGTHMGHTIGSGSVQGGSQSQISKFKLGAEIKENETAALNKAYDSSTAYLSSLKGVFSKTGQEQFNHSFSNAYQTQLKNGSSSAAAFQEKLTKAWASEKGISEDAAAKSLSNIGLSLGVIGSKIQVTGGSTELNKFANKLMGSSDEGRTLTTDLAKTAAAIKNNMGGNSSNFTTSNGTSEDVARAEQEMVKDTATLSAMQSYSKSHSVEESVDMNSLVISGKNTAKGQAAIENLVRYMQKNHADELKERTEHLKPIVGGDGRLATEMAAFEIGQNSSDRETSLMTTNAALTALGFNPDADDTITPTATNKVNKLSNTGGSASSNFWTNYNLYRKNANATKTKIVTQTNNIPSNGTIKAQHVYGLNKNAAEQKSSIDELNLKSIALSGGVNSRNKMTDEDFNIAIDKMNLPEQMAKQIKESAKGKDKAKFLSNNTEQFKLQYKSYLRSIDVSEDNANTLSNAKATVFNNSALLNKKVDTSVYNKGAMPINPGAGRNTAFTDIDIDNGQVANINSLNSEINGIISGFENSKKVSK